MSDFLYQKVKPEDFNEDEQIHTEGDALLFQFYCGNWSASVQRMRDESVSWRDLLRYMEDGEDAPEVDLWAHSHGHFDRAFWGELADTLARPQ